ncbi:MAG: FAD-dependent oxidoreductase, partial [Anaerolineales bacterium]|nr:FAD-dependent oxidoreductase [Anaerolineales bacterium]
LIPRAEDRPVLACTVTSIKYTDRAPDDSLLIRLFLGRAGDEDWVERSDEELTAVAVREVAATLGIEHSPDTTVVQRWPNGMPQYNVGHLKRVRQIKAMMEKHRAFELAGAAYHGIGIPDSIDSGRAAARSLLAVHEKSSPA